MDFIIEYLELAIPKIERRITRIEQFTHNSYFTNQFKHNMHGDNPQLNSIIDTIISLGIQLEKQDKNIPIKRETSQELFYNLEYVKNQNNVIIRTIGSNRNGLLNLHNLRELDKRYNEIKQLLQEIKQLIKT